MLHRPAENNILLVATNKYMGKIKIWGNNSPSLLSFEGTKSGFSPVWFGRNCFALLHCSQWSIFSFLGSSWCFIYSIHSYHSTGSLVLPHFMKLGAGVLVVLINPNFVTAGFCDLGCITPSKADDLQIL